MLIGTIHVKYGSCTHNNIVLEKVLLDPIFMILKCDFFYSLWIVFFLKLHDVSTSHLEALVT